MLREILSVDPRVDGESIATRLEAVVLPSGCKFRALLEPDEIVELVLVESLIAG